MGGRENIDRKVTIRMPGTLFSELESEMSAYGYRTLSQFIRFILEKRKRRDMESIDYSKGSLTAIEHLAAEMRRIGTNYNQFVAAYNRAVRLTGKDGFPVVSEKETRRNQLGLMELTMELTRDVHALMDRFGIEHGSVQIVASQPSSDKGKNK